MGALLDTNIIVQVGLVVKDVEKTAAEWAKFLGVDVPPISWTNPEEVAQTKLNGKPCPARAKLAFFNCGQVQVELIQPDEEDSTWRQALEEHEGFHHIAFYVKGMQEMTDRLEAQGMPLVQKAEYTGGRYSYIDSYDKLKLMIELLENDKK